VNRCKILDRLGVPLFALMDQAAAGEGLYIVGVERERLFEQGHRFVMAAGSGQFLSLRGVALRLLDVLGADLGGRCGGRLRCRLLVGTRRKRAEIEGAAA
jgi:hypothetical protein